MKRSFLLLPLAALFITACSSTDSDSQTQEPADASGGRDAGVGDAATVPHADAQSPKSNGQRDAQPDEQPLPDEQADAEVANSELLHPGVDPGALAQQDNWFCGRSQREVENFTITTLPDRLIDVQHQHAVVEFKWSKPKVSEGRVIVQSYRPLEVERGSVYDQAWCKLKTQKAIEAGLSVAPQGPSFDCKLMNQAAIEWALAHVSSSVKAAWDARGLVIDYADDEVFGRGNQWVPVKMVIERKDDATILIQSKALRVDMNIPRLGRTHYCKTLSPRGAVALVSDVANLVGIGSDTSEFPIGTDGYTIDPTRTTLYEKGFVAHIKAGNDEVDVFVPVTPTVTPLPAAIYMQGGKVDKAHYANHNRLLAAHGFVVAVANHNSLSGTNMTEQSVFNDVWAQLQALAQDPESPLHGRVDPAQVAVMGHSLGGVASLAILAGTCTPPTCFFGYNAPAELRAGVLYGTNTKTPVLGNYSSYNVRNLPTLFVQGSVDGMAALADGLKTFQDHILGVPRGFVTIEGANHYGITDTNQPAGAKADSNASTLNQGVSNETVARWTAMFLRAHMHGDDAARDYIYGGTGDAKDTNATIQVID